VSLRALLPLLAVAAAGITVAAEPPLSTLVYLCEQSRVLSVVQRNPASPGQSVEVTFGTDGKRMQPVVAASGARYLSTDGAWNGGAKGRRDASARPTAQPSLPLHTFPADRQAAAIA